MTSVGALAAWAASCALFACALERGGMLDSRGGDAAQGGTAGVSGAPFGGTGGGAGWAGSGGTLGDAAGDQGSESGAADAPADSPHSDGPDGWSTWNPATAADCVLWLDASDPSTLNTVGPNVNSWASKCGLALGSASGTQRPVLAITNGRPTVHCDGLDDRLVIGGSGVAATQYSVLIVIDKPAGAPSQQVLWSNRGLVPPVGGTATWFGTLNGSLLVYQDSATPAAALLGTSKLDGKTAVLELAVSTLGDRAAYREGLLEQSDSGSSGLTTLLGTSDLCHDAVNMEHGSFDIFEVVAFAHRLTAVERADATNALKKKWGL